MKTSAISARRLLLFLDSKDPKESRFIEFTNELYGRLADELNTNQFFSLEPANALLFGEPDRFGSEVASRFPNAAFDIEESAKCLALGRGTACVFHLMRVLELALYELGMKLGLTLVAEKNWQKIINDMNGAVNKLPRTTQPEKEYLAKCSETVLHFQHVKDAWRNDVMHPRDVYTEEQALEVFETTRRLMKSLAAFL